MSQIDDYLRFQCLKGLASRGLADKKEYRDRLDYELGVINLMGFSSYFLIVWDMLRFARQQNILHGPGRGSVSGSIAAYCLYITEIDPIQYGLIFERFLNVGRRGTFPDIDCDICPDRREEVVQYLAGKYKYISRIGTFSLMRAKNAIKNTARALGHPTEIGDELAKLTLEPIHGKPQSLATSIEKVPELQEHYNKDGAFGYILHTAEKLEGLVNNVGVHAAGVVLSAQPLDDALPLYRARNEEVASCWEMNTLEKLGYIKFDILGLDTLTRLKVCLELIKKRHGITIDLNTIPRDDAKVYERLGAGDVMSCFQLETSSGLRDLIVQIRPSKLEDLSDVVAIYRPGPLGNSYLSDYLQIRAGLKEPTYLMPELEPILGPTSGFLIYQEQVINIAKDLAGYSLKEADELRKCVTGDTLFWTGDKWETAENLAKQDSVSLETIYDHDIKINKAKTFFYTGEKETIKIITVSGTELSCTPDHMVYTDKGFVEAQDLTQEHYILHSHNEKHGNYEIDENLLYIIAAIVTEGYFTKDNSSTFVNKDCIAIQTFIESFEKVFGFLPKTNYFENGVIAVQIPVEPKRLLYKYGLSYSLAEDKVLPKDFLNLNQKQLTKLLGLLIDFDGWISPRKCGGWEIGYCSKSEKLIHQIKILFENIGVRASIYKKYNKKYKRFYYTLLILDRKDLSIVINKLSLSHKIIKYQDNIRTYINDSKSIYSCYVVPKTRYFRIIEDLIGHSGYSRNSLIGKETTGSYFKGPITISRLSSILKVCGRNKELESYIEQKAYWDKVGKIEPNGLQKVYDFTMSSDRSPWAFANSLLIHNCMGKKQEKEMALHEEKFKRGCAAKRLGSDAVNMLWANLKEFAEYGFVKAHAMAYSLISYRTAYLKTHYPSEWMCSVMTCDMNNPDQMVKYIAECRRLGIQLSPPDINSSEEQFGITDKGHITFGLVPIRNMGLTAARHIIEKRKKKPFADFYDFCARVNVNLVNKLKITSLIRAGAFDSLGPNRASLLAAMENVWEFKDQEKIFQNKFATYVKKKEAATRRLDEISKGLKTRPLKEPKRPDMPMLSSMPDTDEIPLDDLLAAERSLLGFYVTEHPLDDFDTSKIDNIALLKELGMPGKTGVAVVIATKKEMTTKKAQKKMAFATLEDKTGQIDAVIFPRTYERYHKLLESTKPLYMTGDLDVTENDDSRVLKFKVSQIQELDKVLPRLGRDKIGNTIDVTIPIACLSEVSGLLSTCTSGTIKIRIHAASATKDRTNFSFNKIFRIESQVLSTIRGICERSIHRSAGCI